MPRRYKTFVGPFEIPTDQQSYHRFKQKYASRSLSQRAALINMPPDDFRKAMKILRRRFYATLLMLLLFCASICSFYLCFRTLPNEIGFPIGLLSLELAAVLGGRLWKAHSTDLTYQVLCKPLLSVDAAIAYIHRINNEIIAASNAYRTCLNWLENRKHQLEQQLKETLAEIERYGLTNDECVLPKQIRMLEGVVNNLETEINLIEHTDPIVAALKLGYVFQPGLLEIIRKYRIQ